MRFTVSEVVSATGRGILCQSLGFLPLCGCGEEDMLEPQYIPRTNSQKIQPQTPCMVGRGAVHAYRVCAFRGSSQRPLSQHGPVLRKSAIGRPYRFAVGVIEGNFVWEHVRPVSARLRASSRQEANGGREVGSDPTRMNILANNGQLQTVWSLLAFANEGHFSTPPPHEGCVRKFRQIQFGYTCDSAKPVNLIDNDFLRKATSCQIPANSVLKSTCEQNGWPIYSRTLIPRKISLLKGFEGTSRGSIADLK